MKTQFSILHRTLVFAYGVASYAVSVGVLAYTAGFLGNLLVPKSIDSPAATPFWQALLINLGLIVLFSMQHSVMARPSFKRWWTRIVPEPAERSTYMVFTCLALFALFYFWQPMGGTIWHVENPIGSNALNTAFAFGWVLILAATFQLNHFELFGLRQVWLHLRGREYTSLPFKTPSLYKIVRHPLYVGWLLTFWATPTMTAAHLFFAVGTTLYILIAIWFEERNLVAHHPPYAEYRRRVPMLVPSFGAPAESEAILTSNDSAHDRL